MFSGGCVGKGGEGSWIGGERLVCIGHWDIGRVVCL